MRLWKYKSDKNSRSKLIMMTSLLGNLSRLLLSIHLLQFIFLMVPFHNSVLSSTSHLQLFSPKFSSKMNNQAENVPVQPNFDGYRYCNLCQLDFYKLEAVLKHQKAVHGNARSKCPTCRRRYLNSAELTIHRQNNSH